MTENNSKINKQEKEETVNLVQLASIVFPNLDKITAERKASKTFKRACKVLGIDPDTFKTNRDYAIPKASIKMWALLMKNIDAVEGNPSKNGFVNFIGDVIRTKNELDEQMKDITMSRPIIFSPKSPV